MPRTNFALLEAPERQVFPAGQELKVKRPSAKCVLFAEGYDEAALLNYILNSLEPLPSVEDIAIINLLGKDKKPKIIGSLVPIEIRSQIKSYFFLIDAERREYSSTVAAVKSIAAVLGFPPEEFKEGKNPQWQLATGEKFSFYIAPNNKDNGAIDSFLLRAVKATEPLSCLDDFIDCVYHGKARPDLIKLEKFKMRALISAKIGSGSLSVALDRSLFSFKGQDFQKLKSYLKMAIK